MRDQDLEERIGFNRILKTHVYEASECKLNSNELQ
jgi:hypothetical protein